MERVAVATAEAKERMIAFNVHRTFPAHATEVRNIRQGQAKSEADSDAKLCG